MSSFTPDEPVDVLLVEDNPGDVRLTKEAFRSIDTETIFHVAEDADEVAEYFDLHRSEAADPHPDLVLLDLNLPTASGFDVLEALEEKLDYPPPPILVLSSSKSSEDVERSYEHAANAYLTKPDDMDQFSAMAQAIDDFWLETARHPPTPT